MIDSTISPVELAQLHGKGTSIQLIDVRLPAEYREVHVAFARNVPLDSLDPHGVIGSLGDRAEEPVYLICRSGKRGRQACEKFFAAGYRNVRSVEGGTLACLETSLPLVRGPKAISLERQVRIAAGSLVVLGVALGTWTHPAFFGVSAFIGGGLVFSGITDTCGLAVILARMPWNR